jgi:hypothetical protein
MPWIALNSVIIGVGRRFGAVKAKRQAAEAIATLKRKAPTC